ncbi:MAG TPA: DUF2723 domain-containing protein [Candidatus Cloacimonadota bacterium]|nr:DUF2723 domain-containing protein [Candidatus Cloacimonadota bacterium]
MAKKMTRPETKLLKKGKNEIEFNENDLRPQDYLSKRANALLGLFVFVFTLIIYMITNAKSLSFWDAGEYIACSSILGVPHPPGNPFYILLGRFFCMIGFGLPHAAVISFLSSLFSALAVLFTYLITVQLLSMTDKNKYFIASGGIIAAFLTAFSFTFWMNSIEAEVYSGLAFVINIAVWLTLVWVKKQKDFSHQNLLLVIIYILFLGFCIHQTSLQVAPALLFIAVYPLILPHLKKSSFWGKTIGLTVLLLIIYKVFDMIGKSSSVSVPALDKFAVGAALFVIMYYYMRDLVEKKVWLLMIILIIIGFSPHLFLLVRSGARPFINEGHPHNISLFTEYILRRQYGDFSFLERRASFFSEQMGFHFLRYFSWQFMNVETVAGWFKSPVLVFQMLSNLVVSFLGLLGFFHTFRKNKHSFAYLTALFFMASIAMVFVINLSNAEVRDRDYFFVTAYNFWAIAMGIGVVGLLRLFDFSKAKKTIQTILLILLLAYPFVNLASQFYEHNRTGELISLDYGLNLLNSVEENAIIFTNGDNDTFPLWYAQAVRDPYAKEYVHEATEINPTEKTKELIAGAIAYKNKECAGIRKDVTVANLSLLNTPWYIKQLRDKEGVELNLTDEQIDNIVPIKLPNEAVIEIGNKDSDLYFPLYLPKDHILYIKDVAIIQIIKDNFGKRPIYFAITCSDASGFEKHLRNEGMVDRVVVSDAQDNINAQRLEKNLTEVYQYRGIFNDKLYKDDNMTRLITNYGAAYMRLSGQYQYKKDYDKAIEYFEKGLSFVKKQEHARFIPLQNYLYIEAGKINEAEKNVQELVKLDPKNNQVYIQFAYTLLRSGKVDKAFEYFDKAINITPQDSDLASLITQSALAYKRREKGIELLVKMVPYLPDAAEYIEYLKDPNFTLDNAVSEE